MAIGMIVVAVICRIASEGGLGKGIEEKRIKRQSPIRFWVLGAMMLALFLLAPNGDRNHYARFADVSWIRPLGVLLTGWGYAFLLWSNAVSRSTWPVPSAAFRTAFDQNAARSRSSTSFAPRTIYEGRRPH